MTTLTYSCLYKEITAIADWLQVPPVLLVDAASGNQPRLETVVRACWDLTHVTFRFECEDDHVVATYRFRDDPLYYEDVVEVFIDETGDGKHYKEFEVSPHNVLFDALIDNDLQGSIQINEKWNAEGIETTVYPNKAGPYIYTLHIPHAVFSHPPQAGASWRINFYRIDDDRQGNRHWWAWSQTGLNFHTPALFGEIVFEYPDDVS